MYGFGKREWREKVMSVVDGRGFRGKVCCIAILVRKIDGERDCCFVFV